MDKTYWEDLLERAGWSALLQAASIVALAIGTVTNGAFGMVPWLLLVYTSAGAFLVSALTTLLQFSIPGGRTLPYKLDLVVRLVKTFIASFLALLTVGTQAPDVVNFGWRGALNAAAITTMLALAKIVLAHGRNGTASTAPSVIKHYEKHYGLAR